jgi:poly-gamma-glutamate synthesis protein (capsule biosynthesis protein)
VPQAIISQVAPVLAQAGFVQANDPEGATLRVVLHPGPEAILTTQWVYAVATPFPTIPDDVSWAALQSYWGGDLAALPAFGRPPRIALTTDEADLLVARLGAPAEGVPLDLVAPAQWDQLVEQAWNTRPAISVVPFEELEPRWKVLTVDRQSVLDKMLDLNTYPLTVWVGVLADGETAAQVAAALPAKGAWQTTNRDPGQLTTLVMTGVTAMARATAWHMEIYGVNFPAENILPFFAGADLLHTSNEVSFAKTCPEPELEGEAVFCSQREYYTLLETIGLDIVELTGNHINDWGTEALNYTLDVYDANGLPYYGGGRDLTDAATPRFLAAPNGTRIAFVGCNSAGPYRAWATDYTPGAAPCEDWLAFRERITQLKENGEANVVVATLQYAELPQYYPSPQQIEDFEALSAAGADIVSGSQAHQPMGFGFANGGFIHFGVGNLFFDQMDYIENRQMFADKHVLYAGRHISTILFTGMMESWSQPRPMTPEERAVFLRLIFEASGW